MSGSPSEHRGDLAPCPFSLPRCPHPARATLRRPPGKDVPRVRQGGPKGRIVVPVGILGEQCPALKQRPANLTQDEKKRHVLHSKRSNSNHLPVPGRTTRDLSVLFSDTARKGCVLSPEAGAGFEATQAARAVSWYSRLPGLATSPCSDHSHDIQSVDHCLMSRETHALGFHPLAC